MFVIILAFSMFVEVVHTHLVPSFLFTDNQATFLDSTFGNELKSVNLFEHTFYFKYLMCVIGEIVDKHFIMAIADPESVF
jgi:hypothetical protein